MNAEIQVQAVQEEMANEDRLWGAVPEPSCVLA